MSAMKEVMETTTEELDYREKNYYDNLVLKRRHIACASCGNELNVLTRRVFSHPWMKLLQCEPCLNRFKEVSTRFEEDETQKYCYICGNNDNNGKLYECGNKECISAFCRKCIKRNVNIALWDAERDNWQCFTCNPKPLWRLRAICAIVMTDLSKKVNRRDTQKFEKPTLPSQKHTLPSQKQRVNKTKEVQKALKALCDEDDDSDCSDNSSFIIARSEQKVYNKNFHVNQDSSQINILEVNLTDSSNENSSTSYEQDKQEKSKKCQKTRLVDKQDLSSRKKKDSKLVTNEKSNSRKNRISDDSDADSSDISSSKTIKQKYVIKKSKETGSNYTNFSDSESENDSINETSITSKNLPKHITQQKKKKTTSSYNMKSIKDKLKRHYDSSNESDEDEDDIKYKKQIKKKNSNKSYNNKEKHENNKKLLKRQFCKIQKDDSDTSSGKEFQKIKIQKVHGDKYSKKQEASLDLEIDNMKSVDSENEKSEESIEEQAILNFNKAKRILKECKKAHLNFLMYIKSIEVCEEKDEEQLIIKSIQEINKLKMTLEKKQKDLTTFYQSRFSSSKTRKTAKKLDKIVSDNEQSLEIINIHKRQAMNDNEYNSGNERESKDVSECDSEKIFSADEMKIPQKIQITGNKKDVSRIEDDMDDINFEVDENEILMDKLKDNDNNSMDLQDREYISPVLSISKAKRIRIENIEPIEKQLSSTYVKSNNKETQLVNTDSKLKEEKLRIDDIYEISSENSVKDNNKMTLENLNQNLDYSDIYENSLQNEVPSKEDNTSTLLHNEKNDLSNREEDNQKKIIFAFANKEKISKEIDVSKKTFDNIESVNEAEMLAKKALLESDSDTDDIMINANLAEQVLEEDLIIDISLKKNAEDNYSDISSNSSTVILSTPMKSKNNVKIKTKITNEEKESQLNKKSDSSEMSQISDETNAKKEQSTKKILLESHSEDALSITSLLLDSEGTEEKNKLNISRTNADAKKALLASSSESSEIEMNILKKIKDTKNHEINNDENLLIARVKKRKLKLSKNDYYKKDKKLRMSCEVRLERLNEKVLERYSHVLKKSREYLEQKALKRYQTSSLKLLL